MTLSKISLTQRILIRGSITTTTTTSALVACMTTYDTGLHTMQSFAASATMPHLGVPASPVVLRLLFGVPLQKNSLLAYSLWAYVSQMAACVRQCRIVKS